MNGKKMFSLLLASLMLTSTLTACTDGQEAAEPTPSVAPSAAPEVEPSDAPESETAVDVGTLTTAESELSGVPVDFVLEAAGIPGETVVMTVDGVDVTARMMFYWTVATFDKYAQMGASDWSMDVGDGLTLGDLVIAGSKDTAVFHQVVKAAAAEKDCAMNALNQADYAKRVEDMKSSMASQSSTDAEVTYNYWLAYMGINQADFDEMSQTAYELENLENYFYGEDGEFAVTDADLDGWIAEDGLVNAKHILVLAQPSEDGSDDGMAAALETANDIRAQLAEEGDTVAVFEALMYNYSDDVDMYTGMLNNADGYTVDAEGNLADGSGALVPSFVETAQSLEMGEVSDPVQSDYGYHILMRTEANREILQSIYVDNAMSDLSEGWFEAAQVETMPEFDAACSVEAYAKFNDVVRPIMMQGLDSLTVTEEAPATDGE